MSDVDVVVVGGGIAGLGAAHHLSQAGRSVLVLEREAEPGGRMRSVQWHGHWVDVGAEEITGGDGFFADVAARHGLEVMPHLAGSGGYGVVRDGRVHMIELADPTAYLRYTGMSPRGRAQLVRLVPTMLRAAIRARGADLDEVHRAADLDTMSLEQWLGRAAPELLEYVVEPLFDVFCGWTPGEMSRAWFAFTSMVYGGASGLTLRQGVGAIPRVLATELDVRCGATVTEVDARSRRVTWAEAGVERTIDAGAVVVAVPGHLVNGIVTGIDDDRRAHFAQVRYVPHNTLYLWLDHVPSDVPRIAFFPRAEDTRLSSIGVGLPTAPDAPVVRLGLKALAQRAHLDRSDEDYVAACLDAVARYHGSLPSLVVDHLLWRWEAALPIFPPGSVRALQAFRSLAPLPGVAFAGDHLANSATGAAYVTGRRAAQQVVANSGAGVLS